jgi:hypothetical protein
MPWSAGCIINTSESKFSVHTGAKLRRPSPLTEARVEGLFRRLQLPASTNATHGSEQIDQETDYRPHCFWRAHCSNRGHLCCCRCSAMVGRDDLRPCSARGHCSRHGSSRCRVSKFQHANSRLENSTSPSTRRDRKTRRDNPPPSSAVSKNTTDPSGWWSRNEEDRVHLLNANRRQTFAGMSDSPLVGMNRDALHDQLELAPLSCRFRHSVPRLSAISRGLGPTHASTRFIICRETDLHPLLGTRPITAPSAAIAADVKRFSTAHQNGRRFRHLLRLAPQALSHDS